MSAQHLPARIRELREKAGLTQLQLAERTEVTRDAIARWEAGRREPTWSNILSLAVALGVTCEAFNQEPADAQPVPKAGRPRKQPAPEVEAVEAKPAAKPPGVKGPERKAKTGD